MEIFGEITWNRLWDGINDSNENRERASEAAIEKLVAAGISLDDNEDIVTMVQSAMEIGFIMGWTEGRKPQNALPR